MSLHDSDMTEIGQDLGIRFAGSTLTSLAELLEEGASACEYAAQDLEECARYERAHVSAEQREDADFDLRAEVCYEEARQLALLANAIRVGEKEGREDHAL